MQLPGLFRRVARISQRRRPAVDERIYAIGDIHGRLDLFYHLLAVIEADQQARAPMPTRVVLLGDFIDRGPHSKQLIQALASERWQRLVILKGNHEAALVDAVRGNHDAMDVWLSFGGDATLRSFGATDVALQAGDTHQLVALARRLIPSRLVDWLDRLPLSYRADRYYFVHAGIRPGVPLDDQIASDQLWIREAFTQSAERHEAIVVHGHSIQQTVAIHPNRIGVDTGAYRTGVLSAVGLEGAQQWIVATDAAMLAG